MDKLNILVLHSLGAPDAAPNFLRHHVFALKANFPEHNYIYHDAGLPLPNYIRDTPFHAIILDVSFLWARWSQGNMFLRRKEQYSFVKYSDAVKIAFPQDEYDCNELLDDWMCDWAVDVVFSVISSNWDVLYPNYHKTGDIRLGYTGYVDESLLNTDRKPFDSRRIDIGYRTRKLPPYFGKIGETKWLIGERVARLSDQEGLVTDIVLGDQGTLVGSSWLDFINNCKFTLGANSGSSLLDPRGEIQCRVKAYLRQHPKATFDEVEYHCFQGMDGNYQFTAISPRVLEAAVLSSCQILVEGEYSGLVKPWEHYIPIKSSATNFAEVLAAMKDKFLVEKMVQNCRSAILDVEELRYRNKAGKVIAIIQDLVVRKHVTSSPDAMQRIIKRYEDDTREKYQAMWRRQDLRYKVVRLIDHHPLAARLARAVYAFAKRHPWVP